MLFQSVPSCSPLFEIPVTPRTNAIIRDTKRPAPSDIISGSMADIFMGHPWSPLKLSKVTEPMPFSLTWLLPYLVIPFLSTFADGKPIPYRTLRPGEPRKVLLVYVSLFRPPHIRSIGPSMRPNMSVIQATITIPMNNTIKPDITKGSSRIVMAHMCNIKV